MISNYLLFSALFTITLSATTCYNSRGLEDAGSLACNPSAAVSSCCPESYVCLSNGLCAPGPDATNTGTAQYYRGTCTDSTWRDASCPQICVASENDPFFQGVTACSGEDAGEYCCFTADGDCCEEEDTFPIAVGRALTTISPVSATNVVISQQTSASTASSATSTESQSPTTSQQSLMSTGESTTTAGNQSPTSSPTAGSPNGSSGTGGSNSNSVAIGAGVGVGVGVPLLIGIIAAIFFYRKKAKRGTAQPTKITDVEEPYPTWKPELDGTGVETRSAKPMEQSEMRDAREPFLGHTELDSTPVQIHEMR